MSRAASFTTPPSSIRRSGPCSNTPAGCSARSAPSCSCFPDPDVDAALRTSSGGVDGDETMVPVSVPVNDPLRARTALEARAFHATPEGNWTTDVGRIREAMIGPLVGEKGVLGAIDHHQSAGRGNAFRGGRPAPARDRRQPGRGRPRERPARAVAARAVAAQGAAPPPGVPRFADRPGEPPGLRRGGRAAGPWPGPTSPRLRSSCSSISTTSRSSTTRWATPRAMSS